MAERTQKPTQAQSQDRVKTQLKLEESNINAMTDTTEQALAMNALKWKIATMKGEKGASAELTRANKDLDTYRDQRPQPDKSAFLKTPEAVARWIIERGYRVPGKTAVISKRSCINYCQQGDIKLVPGRGYALAQIQEFCAKNLSGIEENSQEEKENNDKERLVKARADKLELEIRIKEGKLVPIEDEIRRRVSVIVGMKISMENHRSYFTQMLAEKMKSNEQSSEQCKIIDELVTEAGHIYTDIMLRVFGEIGKQGGVAV